MRKALLPILCLLLALQYYANANVSDNRKPGMLNNFTVDFFKDKDWQIIVKVNKFYLERIVRSKMKLESVEELTTENIIAKLNITREKFNSDIQEVQGAALRLQEKLKTMGIGCENCGANLPQKNASILNILQKMRHEAQFMKKFFNSIEGINLKDADANDCPRAISFLACVGICSAAPPPFNVLCAAACWCEFCRDGEC